MKILLNATLLACFLLVGLWLGPHARNLYDATFPEPSYVTGDYSRIFRDAGNPVVMFSTSTCDHCRAAREFLEREQVDYRDFIIDQSPNAKRRFEMQGGTAVPLLFIGHRRITGFREDTIRESLALIR